MYDVACEFARAAVRSKDAQKQLARTSLTSKHNVDPSRGRISSIDAEPSLASIGEAPPKRKRVTVQGSI